MEWEAVWAAVVWVAVWAAWEAVWAVAWVEVWAAACNAKVSTTLMHARHAVPTTITPMGVHATTPRESPKSCLHQSAGTKLKEGIRKDALFLFLDVSDLYPPSR